MKNIKRKVIFVFTNCFIILSGLCLLQSCDDFVAVDLPTNQLIGATVFEDVATVRLQTKLDFS